MDKFQIHEQICKELNELYRSKNSDYSDSVGQTYEELGIISLVTRISDKTSRLKSLVSKSMRQNNVTLKEIIEKVKALPDNASKEEIVECICELMSQMSIEQIQKVKDESIEDTIQDLANYAIIALVERRWEKEKTGTLAYKDKNAEWKLMPYPEI